MPLLDAAHEAPPADAAPPASPGACPDLFAQDVLPTYDVQIAAEQWAQIRDEFLSFEARQAAGLPLHPYHPVVLHYGEETTDAWIRLKGKTSWFEAVRLAGDKAKMQFVIAFDQGADTKRRFHGVQKVELDHAAYVDPTWLHERLATWFMQQAGIPSACVNNARLVVNGSYYGLYSHLEHPDHDYVRRVFPEASNGDLWSGPDEVEWSQAIPDYAAHDRIWAVKTTAEMASLTDMKATLRDWAAEAMIPDSDGYWGGNHNYFMYRHPIRGWIWLPDDVDEAFEHKPADMSPIFFWLGRVGREPGPHYRLVLGDPAWFAELVDALGTVLQQWDVAKMQSLVDTWSAQIAEAAAADPNVPYTFADHQSLVAALRAHLPARADAVRAWLACAQQGGTDADGDGSPWCTDCDESSAATHLRAPEICGDGRDQSCDGIVDEGCASP